MTTGPDRCELDRSYQALHSPVNAHFDRRLREAGQHRGLGYRKATQLGMNDGQPIAIGQVIEELPNVTSCVSPFAVQSDSLVRVPLERKMERRTSSASSKEIHELIAGDGMRPRGQRPIGAIGVTGPVHRQQHLLKDVLDVSVCAGKPAAQKAPQVYAQIVKEGAIRVRVTLQPRAQKQLEALLEEPRGADIAHTLEPLSY